MRLGALGSLQRGVLNVRANWRLALLGWLQSMLVAAVTVASLLPFYFILGLELPSTDATFEVGLEWAVEVGERLLAGIWTAPFWLALISSSALMMLSLVIYSFFHAGAFALLNQGDLAASPGAAPAVAGFKVFSWSRFQRLGGEWLWRFFWLFNVILLLWTGWLVLVTLTTVVVGLAAGAAGLGAGLALGVAAFLPLAFLFVVLLFWSSLAQVALVATDCTVMDALRQGLVVLTRRLGAVLILFVVLITVTLGTGTVFMLLSLVLGAGLASFGGLGDVLSWGLQSVQWLLTAVLDLVIAATLIALSRDEAVT
jgi:hypothetical protein